MINQTGPHFLSGYGRCGYAPRVLCFRRRDLSESIDAPQSKAPCEKIFTSLVKSPLFITYEEIEDVIISTTH